MWNVCIRSATPMGVSVRPLAFIPFFSAAFGLWLSFNAEAAVLQPALGDDADAAESVNVTADNSAGVTLTLVEDALLLAPGTADEIALDYRGRVSFVTQDNDGPYWIEKSKDPNNGNGSTIFQNNANECIEQQDLEGLASSLGTLSGDVYRTDNARSFRIGPEPSVGTDPVDTAASGDSLIPQGWGATDRMIGFSFLTTGTHVYSSSAVAEEEYTVTLGYDSGDVIRTIPIPLDSTIFAAIPADSSGDGVCDGADQWCVRAHSATSVNSRLPLSECLCDGDGSDLNKCWILEVFVAVDYQQINDITMSWSDYDESAFTAAGLNGPMAMSFDVDEATYDKLFTYDGSYVTQQLDAGANAVWYEIGWDQTASAGEMRVRFECGDTPDVTASTNDWGEDNADPYPFESTLAVPGFPIQSATATLADPSIYNNHCVGRYAEVSVGLLDPFTPGVTNTSPLLESISLGVAVDADGDGYDAEGALGPADCDDSDPNINPGATDIPGDDIDQNCSGTVVCYDDADSDGFGTASSAESTLTATGGHSDVVGACGSSAADVWDDDTLDCNDANAAINPNGQEVCDGLDNDCDGLVDDDDPGVTGQPTWYLDSDGDTYGTSVTTTLACTQPPGYVSISGDCDDSNADVNPGASEICDALDNDCDGLVDDDDPDIIGQMTWYRDADSDAFGTDAETQNACEAPGGYVVDAGDCDDSNPSINPGAVDLPGDDVDDNCSDTVVCFDDDDSDGFGGSSAAESIFTATGGVADLSGACGSDDGDAWDDTSTDCNDGNDAINPDAAEVCDNIDNDCDGLVDEQDDELPAGSCAVIFDDRFESLLSRL